MFKRTFFAVVAAFGLVFALAACGTDASNSNGAGSGGSATVISATASPGSLTAAPVLTKVPSGGGGASNASTTAGAGSGDATSASGGTMTGGTMTSGTMNGATTTGTAMSGSATGSSLDADVPQYTGATALNLSPDMLASFNQSSSNVKNAKVALFKSSDSFDKIKAFYTDAMTKKGYSDQSTMMGMAMANGGNTVATGTDATGAGTSAAGMMGGMQTVVFAKDNKTIALLGIPSQMMGADSTKLGVGPNDTVFAIVSGEK